MIAETVYKNALMYLRIFFLSEIIYILLQRRTNQRLVYMYILQIGRGLWRLN